MSRGDTYFDFWTEYLGEDLYGLHDGQGINLTGYISRYCPATGPSLSHAGGDPAEGGEIEDLVIKNDLGMVIEDPDNFIFDQVEDEIYEHCADADSDGPDPDEAYDSARNGD